MNKETKICLPYYKIAYAVCFTVILSLIRGVEFTNEVGTALEAPMAILAAVFCADTYVQEIISRRGDIWRLYPMKKRFYSVIKRIAVQQICLLLLAAAGYGMFLNFQKPQAWNVMGKASIRESGLFIIYLGAVMVTICFWGILSNTLSCIFRNMWAGVGSCLVIWLVTNSTVGDKYLGKWNVFSYTFSDISSGDFSWICGKVLCICVCIIMLALLPAILKKRG